MPSAGSSGLGGGQSAAPAPPHEPDETELPDPTFMDACEVIPDDGGRTTPDVMEVGGYTPGSSAACIA